MGKVTPPGFFKKLISHVTPLMLEQTGSPYNPQLSVLLSKGRYQLCTKDAIYSYADLYDNFSGSFEAIDLKEIPLRNCLVLGLGLASIPYMLETKFNMELEFTAVEIDSEIIRLANDYVIHDLKSHIQTIECDALHFVNVNLNKYDLVIMDVFQSAEIPQKFQNAEFLNLLKSKLNDEALLMYNRLNISNEDHEENNKFEMIFKEVFKESTYLELHSNKMFFNTSKYFK